MAERLTDDYDCAQIDVMLYALEKWIAMPTVSGVPSQLEECRRGAKFLKAVLQQLGAESRLIPGAPGQNPLVYGQFSARTSQINENARPLNVLVYGHYDVIAADSKKWDHPPFKLTGKEDPISPLQKLVHQKSASFSLFALDGTKQFVLFFY